MNRNEEDSMIELLCEGHEAAYELGNVRNLFLPYVQEELVLETIYDGEVAKAYLKKEGITLQEAVYPVVLVNDEIKDKKTLK